MCIIIPFPSPASPAHPTPDNTGPLLTALKRLLDTCWRASCEEFGASTEAQDAASAVRSLVSRYIWDDIETSDGVVIAVTVCMDWLTYVIGELARDERPDTAQASELLAAVAMLESVLDVVRGGLSADEWAMVA